MKKLLTILSFLPMFCSCQKYTLGTISTAKDTVRFVGKKMVFIGNSIVQGYNVAAGSKFTTVFTTAKGGIEVNMGISAQVLQAGGTCGNTVFDKTTIPYYDTTYAILVIALGVNDLGLNTSAYTSSKYGLTLDTTITFSINSRNWPHKRIVIMTPFWYTNYAIYNSYTGCGHVQSDATIHDAYAASGVAIGSSKGCTVLDIYTDMKNSPANGTFLQGDGLHINATGSAFVASDLQTVTYNQR